MDIKYPTTQGVRSVLVTIYSNNTFHLFDIHKQQLSPVCFVILKVEKPAIFVNDLFTILRGQKRYNM